MLIKEVVIQFWEQFDSDILRVLRIISLANLNKVIVSLLPLSRNMMMTYPDHDFNYELLYLSLLSLFFTQILKDFRIGDNQLKLALSLEYNTIPAN